LKSRFIAVIIIQICTIITIFFIESRTESAYANFQNPNHALPITIGSWKGVDYKLDESVYDILETPFIVHRTYSNQNSDVLLSIVAYPNVKVDFHKPESCLGGKGIEIDKSLKTITINSSNHIVSLPIVELKRQSSMQNLLVYYFFRTGKTNENSLVKARLNIFKNRLFGGFHSNMLIRVSTPLRESNDKHASKTLKRFLGEIYPILAVYQ